MAVAAAETVRAAAVVGPPGAVLAATAVRDAAIAAIPSYCTPAPGAPSTSLAASGNGIVATTPWQRSLITGLGEVLSDRAKAEVQAWFEELVREELCKLKSSDDKGAARWFPQTCKLFDDRQGAGQQLASSMIADAMRSDLLKLSGKVALYLKAHSREPSVVGASAAIVVVAVAADSLIGRRSPLLWLRDLSSNEEVRKACKARDPKSELTLACSVVFAGIAVHHYGWVVNQPRVNGQLDRVAIQSSVKKVFDADAFRCKVVEAMTDQKCDNPNPELPTLVRSFFGAADGEDAATFGKLLTVFQDMVDINDLVAQMDGPSDLSRAKELVAKFDELLDHVEALLGIPQQRDLQALRHFVHASISIANRDYAAAARSLVEGLNLFGVSLPKWASRFLPLIVDLAESKSSGDVSAALERAIAPVGSWRLKRQKNLISVSALVGGAAGYEWPVNGDAMGGVSFDGGWSAGLIAPVGVHFSTPAGDSSSLGVLLSVLDVGQVTWTRVFEKEQSGNEAGVEQTPNADFAKVFSPGAYLTIGIGNSPFVAGLGGSYAPSLRSYTYQLDGTERSRDVSVWRFGIFAAVDVTLLPFSF